MKNHALATRKMAKVTGPLFSVEASGGYAGVIVFAKWKGRQYVRQLVIPSNPQTAGQEAARNAVRVAAAGQKFANANVQIHEDLTLNDKLEMQAIVPSGFAWNGFLVDNMIGSGAVNMTASDAIWTGLAAGEKTAWDDAAAALTAPILAVAQTIAGGGAGTPKTAGNVFLNYDYGLFAMGLVLIPAAAPPTYV